MENYCYNSSSYPESGHSSPRSREIEYDNPMPWEDGNQALPPNYKVKLMCSYGGQIQPRPHDNQLSYIGGETKILALDRMVKFSNLLSKLVAMCDCDAISFKYQLPGEDLDALISVTNDDDLEHMMHEYDRLYRVSPKPPRLRIFIFQSPNLPINSSVRGFRSDEGKTDKERFLEALNSAPVTAPVHQPSSPAILQPPSGNVDLLIGLEKANSGVGAKPTHQQPICRIHEFEDPVVPPHLDERLIATDPIQKHIQDLQRLRIEDQQGLYRRKNDDTISGASAGTDYYKGPEKISQVPLPRGIPYWAEKQVPGGIFPSSTTAVSNDQQIYVIPTPSAPIHAPMVRPVTATHSQGYYTVQRIPTDAYRDQHQPVYSMIPSGGVSSMAVGTAIPPQVSGYPGGVGMVTDSAYAPVAFDGGTGRPVIYSAPGGLVSSAAQYHVVASADGRQTAEGAGKLVKTQASI